ncbi:hypothetical protein ACFL43_03835, partial [Thermodesulfobacteriota bacterium]
VTASEIKLNEFGYNSVFVRNPELKAVFDRMIAEDKLLRRPMWEGKGRHLRTILEPLLPQHDVMHFRDYVKNGEWRSVRNIYKRTEPGYTGTIMGMQRLFLMQTTKEKIFRRPALKALEKENKFVTDWI